MSKFYTRSEWEANRQLARIAVSVAEIPTRDRYRINFRPSQPSAVRRAVESIVRMVAGH